MSQDRHSRDAQLKEDLSKSVMSVMKNDPTLTPEVAMRKITTDMLANNPLTPPTGCPVNDLPPELLAYIFMVGTIMEADDESTEEEEEEFIDEHDLKEDWTDEEDEDSRPGKTSSVKLSRAMLVQDDETVVTLDGNAMDVDENHEDHGSDYVEDEGVLPFQVLVSHVCRHWREIALASPILWTRLTFTEGPPFEKSRTWIQRSKGLPIDINIDCTVPDGSEDNGFEEDHFDNSGLSDASLEANVPISGDQPDPDDHEYCPHPPPSLSLPDLNTILDIIIPHVSQWRSLEVSASVYRYIHTLLSRLADCPSAPLLEVLGLYHYEDCEDYDEFRPAELRDFFLIFQGNAPNLRDVALWGVHLDWDRSLTFLSGLRELELTYHAEDVRPSFSTFAQIIALSPELQTLSLCLSGPQEYDDEIDDWGSAPIEILSLKDLVLCYHKLHYACALVGKFYIPNVHSLALDFDGEDYSKFAETLTHPMPKSNKSILTGLEHIKISGLPCNKKSINMLFEQLSGLKTITLNCSGQEEMMLFDQLTNSAKSASPPTSNKIYCPNLHAITTTGVDGTAMCSFIEARQAAGVPIKRLMMSEEDDVDEKDEKWLRKHVGEFDFFEPSDSEEEFVELDDDLSDMDFI